MMTARRGFGADEVTPLPGGGGWAVPPGLPCGLDIGGEKHLCKGQCCMNPSGVGLCLHSIDECVSTKGVPFPVANYDPSAAPPSQPQVSRLKIAAVVVGFGVLAVVLDKMTGPWPSRR